MATCSALSTKADGVDVLSAVDQFNVASKSINYTLIILLRLKDHGSSLSGSTFKFEWGRACRQAIMSSIYKYSETPVQPSKFCFTLSAKMWLSIATALIAFIVVAVLLGFRNAPQVNGPRGLPILGHLRELLRPDFHRVLSDWADVYGGIYRISILGLPGVVVSDPQAIAQVLGRDTGTAVPKHLASYQQLNLLWGSLGQHSIFTGSNTDLWRAVRKAVSPCFSSANVRYS